MGHIVLDLQILVGSGGEPEAVGVEQAGFGGWNVVMEVVVLVGFVVVGGSLWEDLVGSNLD